MQQHRGTHNSQNSGLSHHEQEMLIKSFPSEIKFSYEKALIRKFYLTYMLLFQKVENILYGLRTMTARIYVYF